MENIVNRFLRILAHALVTAPAALTLSIVPVLLSATALAQDGPLTLNDHEYFERRGLNVFVFSNQYNGMFFDEKTAGIELIHHGVRTATGGAVRLQNTPEQWDLIPTVVNRKVDQPSKTISVELTYKDYNFNSKLSVTPKDNGVEINVYLDKPLPKDLEGKAGFNLTIAGGVVPGLLLLKPDFLENKDDWPFLWGENECVIDGG